VTVSVSASRRIRRGTQNTRLERAAVMCHDDGGMRVRVMEVCE
jgi:hypothetical protein